MWSRENRGLYQIPALSGCAHLDKPLNFCDIHSVIKWLPYRFYFNILSNSQITYMMIMTIIVKFESVMVTDIWNWEEKIEINGLQNITLEFGFCPVLKNGYELWIKGIVNIVSTTVSNSLKQQPYL